MEASGIAAFTYHPKPHNHHHHLLHHLSSGSIKKPSFRPRPSPSPPGATASPATIPTMAEIMESCRARDLDLQIRTVGPFFRVTARNMKTQKEVGWAQGLTRVWFGGKILHLDSIRMGRETVGMEKSIFGVGVFVGAVAIRHGYDSGCTKAELLAINDSHLYHSKLVRFYKRIGFKVVHEVKGESMGDMGHMLVWGGIGTRMDANLEQLLIKWAPKFKPIGPNTINLPQFN